MQRTDPADGRSAWHNPFRANHSIWFTLAAIADFGWEMDFYLRADINDHTNHNVLFEFNWGVAGVAIDLSWADPGIHLIQSVYPVTLVNDDLIKIEAVGTSLTVYQNGVIPTDGTNFATANDPTMTVTGPGYCVIGGDGVNWRIDDFSGEGNIPILKTSGMLFSAGRGIL